MGQRLEHTQPNAVVLERSNEDAGDINAQRIAALHRLDEKLQNDWDAAPPPPVPDEAWQRPQKRARRVKG